MEILAREGEVMTNQQFDAIIKMVLNLIDSNTDKPDIARKMIVDLLIDERARQEHEKPLGDRYNN
ncbi:MAG: hypothetical protein LBS24_07070 [Clostridiales Family XIII bacterium]|jgi:hypothetical protein|nr:hypothetical protein [Clostridiales Family XIII bacterium]